MAEVQTVKFDVRQAYNQVEVGENSKKYLPLATHVGLFTVNRLPFGIKTAPSSWQSIMEKILNGIQGVHIYYDDILIASKTRAEHTSKMDKVLARLHKAGVRLNREKCSFFQQKVTYLGHVFSAEGIAPIPEKMEAIL